MTPGHIHRYINWNLYWKKSTPHRHLYFLKSAISPPKSGTRILEGGAPYRPAGIIHPWCRNGHKTPPTFKGKDVIHPVRYFVAGFLAGALIIALTEMKELWENLTVFKKQQPEGNSS
jgi:hypothetical protein